MSTNSENIKRIKSWIKHSLSLTDEVLISGHQIDEWGISSIMRGMNLYAYYDKRDDKYHLRTTPYLPRDMAEFYQSYPKMAKAIGMENIKVITQ